jgi:hypothetical protein
MPIKDLIPHASAQPSQDLAVTSIGKYLGEQLRSITTKRQAERLADDIDANTDALNEAIKYAAMKPKVGAPPVGVDLPPLPPVPVTPPGEPVPAPLDDVLAVFNRAGVAMQKAAKDLVDRAHEHSALAPEVLADDAATTRTAPAAAADAPKPD